MDTHELLHKFSFHPKHTFFGILKSQFLRFHRICNNYQDFIDASKTLTKVLINRGYSKSLMRKTLREKINTLKPRFTKTNSRCTNTNCKLCPQYLNISTHIKDHKNNNYPFDTTLNCQSSNIIYAIHAHIVTNTTLAKLPEP